MAALISTRRIAAVAFVLSLAAGSVQAATAPADPCSLLTAAQVSSTMGDSFGAPQESIAPRPFANTVQGTDCHYRTKSGRGEVLFRVYFDPSAADATSLHARLKMFFGSGSVPASVGDEAYIDESHAIHVRKGNVRYYIAVSGGDTQTGKNRTLALANLLAGEI